MLSLGNRQSSDEDGEPVVPMSRFGSILDTRVKPEKPTKIKQATRQAIVSAQEEAVQNVLEANLISMIQVFQSRSDQLCAIVEGLAALGTEKVGLVFAKRAEDTTSDSLTQLLLDFGFKLLVSPQDCIGTKDFFTGVDVSSTPTEADLEQIQIRDPLQKFDLKVVVSLNRRFFEWRQWYMENVLR